MSREFEYIGSVTELEYDFSIKEFPEVYTRFVIIEKVSKKKYKNSTDQWRGHFKYEWDASHTIVSYSNKVVDITEDDILSYGS